MCLGQWLEARKAVVGLGFKVSWVNAGFQKMGSAASAWNTLHPDLHRSFTSFRPFQPYLLMILATTVPGSSPPLPSDVLFFLHGIYPNNESLLVGLSAYLLNDIFLRHAAEPTDAIQKNVYILNIFFLCGKLIFKSI